MAAHGGTRRQHRIGCALASFFLAACATMAAANPTQISEKPGETAAMPSEGAPSVQAIEPAVPAPESVAPKEEPVALPTTQAPVEVWDRIRRGFAMPDLRNDLVRQHERAFAARPEYLQRMAERSRRYMFYIVEELEQRNMPAELALLPFIESAFNPQAVSIARAAGLWQFMPATGRDFSLKQNVFRDDRRDVLASTRAALDYLQKLYGMFGDWHLALASYNWGEGSVGRAIARNKSLGKGTRYEDLNMPAETRNYVPKLQAIKNIVAAPQDFNAELPVIANHPYFQDVEIKRDIDVALAAKLAGVQLEDFRALNPSASRPIILAAGQGKILLPWDNAEVFKRNLEAYRAGRLSSWSAWSVPSTMSVSEAAKRSGMSEAELRSVNSIPPRMLIRAGSTLVVTRQPHMHEDVSDHLADNASLVFAPEVSLRKATVKARKGDTVALIARRHKLSAEKVAEWNKVSASAQFKAGESVVIYLPPKAASGTGKAQPQPAAKPTPKAKPKAKPKQPSPQKKSSSPSPKKGDGKP